jgi:hypothetical protein
VAPLHKGTRFEELPALKRLFQGFLHRQKSQRNRHKPQDFGAFRRFLTG